MKLSLREYKLLVAHLNKEITNIKSDLSKVQDDSNKCDYLLDRLSETQNKLNALVSENGRYQSIIDINIEDYSMTIEEIKENKPTNQLNDIVWFMGRSFIKDQKYYNYKNEFKFITYVNNKNRLCLVYWFKNSKKSYNYYYSNEDNRNDTIFDMISIIEYRLSEMLKHKASSMLKKEQNAENFKVGDVFCYSFGYDATYYNFYQVVKKVSKFKVLVKEIETETVGHEHFDYKIKFLKDVFVGDEIKATINQYGLVIGGNDTSKVIDEDRTYRQSNSQFV